MSVERQVIKVDRVKKSESEMIIYPITVEPERKVKDSLVNIVRYFTACSLLFLQIPHREENLPVRHGTSESFAC
jgi:hypothetical protein